MNRKGVLIEFPKLTDQEMEMFIGRKDSAGIINWEATTQNFKTTVSEIVEVPDTTVMTDFEYREYLNQKALQRQFERYESIAPKNFGWINCDRFLSDPTPKVDIPLFIADDDSKREILCSF